MRTEAALRAWYTLNGRDLPIRRAASPWHVLVAEVMSQQTQVQRIGPFWERFTAQWPTPCALAAASTADLLDAWGGLGYNSRALRLREAARVICAGHDSEVPRSVDALEALPGVGPYTARAIAVHAFGAPVAPLDVNIRRVLLRTGGRQAAVRNLQEYGDGLVWEDNPAAWANAMMDLATLVCTPRRPACGTCPLLDCASRGSVATAPARVGRSPAFATTNRWLRGEILRRLRGAPRGEWTRIDAPVGVHEAPHIEACLRQFDQEGFIERRGALVRLAR